MLKKKCLIEWGKSGKEAGWEWKKVNNIKY